MFDLETRQFRMLAAIADAGTVTRAAASLNLSQPALSHALRALEERVGVPLFGRGGRTMVLTQAGERLLFTARTVLREIDAARSAIEAGNSGRGEFIRLSTECYTAYHWLPGVLLDFRDACPGVELRIIPSATGDPLHALREGTIDVGIGVTRETPGAIDYHELFTDDLVVVLPAEHPGACKRYFSAEDFRGEHLLVHTDPARSHLIQNVLGPAGIRPREVSRVPAPEALIEMVRAGVGISTLARWAIARFLLDGSLVALPLTPRGTRRTWSAAVRHGEQQAPALTSLVALLRRHAPEFTAPRASAKRRAS